MSKPQEYEFDDLVDHVVECMENLIERADKTREKLEELKEPIGNIEEFMRPYD